MNPPDHSHRPIEDIVVAEDHESFTRLLELSTRTPGFLTYADEQRFARKTGVLQDRIDRFVAQTLGPGRARKETRIARDWWRDHTARLDVTAAVFDPSLFAGLRALLAAEFEDWRIRIELYTTFRSGTPWIGSLAVWCDKLLLDMDPYLWMQKNDFEVLHSVVPSILNTRGDDEV